MPKIRVHQLAKELDIDSKIVMDVAYKHGIEVKNHMSALDTGDEFVLRAYLEAERPNLPKAQPGTPEAEAPQPAPDKKTAKATKPTKPTKAGDVAVIDSPAPETAPTPAVR